MQISVTFTLNLPRLVYNFCETIFVIYSTVSINKLVSSNFRQTCSRLSSFVSPNMKGGQYFEKGEGLLLEDGQLIKEIR